MPRKKSIAFEYPGPVATRKKSIDAKQAVLAPPKIHAITPADLKDALLKGFEDFKEKPSHLLLLAAIYPIACLVAAAVASNSELLPLVFPLVAGFALLGPLAAIGLYELSRRREKGLKVSWEHAFKVLRSPSIGAIMTLSVLLGVIYFAWLGAALAIYWLIFGGGGPESIPDFFRQIFTTSAGWTLIIIGCGVGFVFALVVLAISAVSFPMLLDRPVGTMLAVETSVRAFLANPMTMLMWGVIVAGLLLLGAIPLFVGLAVAMPVLGHATWHLYRKVVEA